MKYFTIYCLLFIGSFYASFAQELNVNLNINTQKISGANSTLFKEMETSIARVLNDQKWTSATFGRNERIDCSITILINELTSNNTINAEISITSRRPVYNSSYVTTLLNFRDPNLSFEYIQGQDLSYNSNYISDNLTAVIAFYAYIVIGLDFDSFQLNAGKPYFAQALDIANSAQKFGGAGWDTFKNNNNRYNIATALTEDAMQEFHTFWYNYHRVALDQMAANPQRARIRTIELIKDLKKIHQERPSSAIFSLFAETKLDEIVRIFSECTPDEKRDMYKTLQSMFPTKTDILKNLK